MSGSAARSQARAVLERARRDPTWFARHVLGCEPWEMQARILESVRDHKYTSVRSCHAAGKSFIAARTAIWFLNAYSPSIVITTAPTERQVRGILWKEIRVAHAGARVPLGGRVIQQEYKVADDRFALGFTAPDWDPERFSGWHSQHILVIVDEASGVKREIQESIDGVLSGGYARKLEIGNPVDPTSEFAKSFRSPRTSKIKISAFDTPNFTARGIGRAQIEDGSWERMARGPAPAPHLVSPEWVADVTAKYGWDNPYVVSRVLAEFPEAGERNVFPLSLIEAAMERELEPSGPVEVVCDVARYGSNESVIGVRRGAVLRLDWVSKSNDAMELVGEIIRSARACGAKTIKVDEEGMGGPVLDRLREVCGPSVRVVGMRAGLPPDGPEAQERFLNRRAQWAFALRDRMLEGTVDLPRDETLLAQMSGVEWTPDSRGRTKLVSKKDSAVPSPDRYDVAAMAFAGDHGDGDEGDVRVW